MPENVLTFIIPKARTRGATMHVEGDKVTFQYFELLETIVVAAEPYDSLVSRSLDAIGENGEFIQAVKMPVQVRDSMVLHNLIERPFLHKSSQFHAIDMEAFLGKRVIVEYP